MIPVIIKKEEVLAELFKGNEVLNIYYGKNTNKPCVRKLTESTVEDVISFTKSLDSDVPLIFIELKKDTTEEQPPAEDNKGETEKQPEDSKEEENV